MAASPGDVVAGANRFLPSEEANQSRDSCRVRGCLIVDDGVRPGFGLEDAEDALCEPFCLGSFLV